MSEISCRHDGKRILLNIAILPPGTDLTNWKTIRALLDTGATNSGVTGAVAEKLGLPMIGKRPLSGVHGEEQVERYLFRIGLFADADAASNIAPRLPFTFDETEGFRLREGFQFEALVGMDILSQCDFSCDRRHNVLLRFGYA